MVGLLSVNKTAAHYRYKTLARSLLLVLVCLSLIALSSYTAPKAQAEAITLSLTTAFLMLVIAVMSTLGVVLTAPSVEVGVDYLTDPFLAFLQGKGYNSIGDYLASVGITAVSQLVVPAFGAINIVKSVYDIIAEFCSSFFSSEGVTSGGSAVGDIGTVNYAAYHGGVSSTGLVDYGGDFPMASSISANGKTITITGTSTAAWVLRLNPGSYTYTISTSAASYSTAYIQLATAYPNTNTNPAPGATRVVSTNRSGSLYIPDSRSGAFGYQGGSTGYTVTVSIIATSGEISQPDGMVITPSATVIDPPSIATGQTYSVPVSGVDSTTSADTAISAAVAPLTTSSGLSQSATVSGTAVTEGMEWLYQDTQAIRENTNPHYDYIPSSSGINIGIWHYVTDMFAVVAPAFTLFGVFLSSLPPIVAVLPFGSLALVFIVALIRRFTS